MALAFLHPPMGGGGDARLFPSGGDLSLGAWGEMHLELESGK
ncbi:MULTISPECIES: hypothetical protein [unclassified Rhodococcus (in: high G+C Gram-positive bacteria)]|nr:MULTISPECIES: hypothetical protein [unclassified Rhodococcus (in: high G+C Gram-positive bacteria)]